MKAIVQDRYGLPDALRLADLDRPVPASGEVLVRVRAAAVNAYDWHMVRGDPYLARLAFGLRRPRARVRGRDFAGVIESVGSAVASLQAGGSLQAGDEVYGEADGAFAEYLCVNADAVDHKPTNLTFEQAAAIPLAGNTALMGVRDAARIHSGQTILINGASGGVGLQAIQIAKSYGATVTAVTAVHGPVTVPWRTGGMSPVWTVGAARLGGVPDRA